MEKWKESNKFLVLVNDKTCNNIKLHLQFPIKILPLSPKYPGLIFIIIFNKSCLNCSREQGKTIAKSYETKVLIYKKGGD